MSRFYRLTAHTNMEDIVKPGEDITPLVAPCQASSFQFLDHKPLTVEIGEESGLNFPDFLCNDGVPLVSPTFKRVLDLMGVDNLFYKPVYLDYKPLGRHEPYILALPPRIRAVRKEYMRPLGEDSDEGQELQKDAYGIPRYKINGAAVGNYRIFKLADVWDDDIIITQDLKEALEKAHLRNVLLDEVEED